MKRQKSVLALLLFGAGLSIYVTQAHAQSALSAKVLNSLPRLQGELRLRSTPDLPSVGRSIVTWAYLPPGYFDPKNSKARYPVVYVLHGQPGTWTDCYISGHLQVVADELISRGAIRPMILLALEGSGPNGPHDYTNFCNRADGYRTEDMIVRDLVPDTDATYRTVPDADHRAFWGYSAGGYAALNIGFHSPDVFHVLASHAGFYQPANDAKIMRRVLGPPSVLWDANSPLLNIANLPLRAPLHIYLDDTPDAPDFDAMTARIRAKEIDLDTDVYSKVHSWKLIREHSARSLAFISRCFASADAPKSKPKPAKDKPEPTPHGVS